MQLRDIFSIKTKKEAQEWKSKYIEYILDNNKDCKNTNDAKGIAEANIGYFAGYGSSKDRERIESLFECSHPLFGSIKENGAPSAEEAFKIGVNLGNKIKNEKINKNNN